MSQNGTGGELPRYFVVQKENDVIILDLATDRYLWRGGVRLDLADFGSTSDDRAVKLDLEDPRLPGFPPRGRSRYWRFDLVLVTRAIVTLIAAHRMTSKGLANFSADLNRQLQAPLRSERRGMRGLAEIAAALEWARILFPLEAKCLPMAIATVKMARYYGYDATLNVGVQALPVKAHAWAQLDDGLINDFLDRVHFFRPIMRLPYRHRAGGLPAEL